MLFTLCFYFAAGGVLGVRAVRRNGDSGVSADVTWFFSWGVRCWSWYVNKCDTTLLLGWRHDIVVVTYACLIILFFFAHDQLILFIPWRMRGDCWWSVCWFPYASIGSCGCNTEFARASVCVSVVLLTPVDRGMSTIKTSWLTQWWFASDCGRTVNRLHGVNVKKDDCLFILDTVFNILS